MDRGDATSVRSDVRGSTAVCLAQSGTGVVQI